MEILGGTRVSKEEPLHGRGMDIFWDYTLLLQLHLHFDKDYILVCIETQNVYEKMHYVLIVHYTFDY